jgi:hypothetical protein
MARLLALLLATLLLGAASPQNWAELARRDLDTIHRTIADNHPGAVNPDDPGFARWLEKGYAEARRRAARAETYPDYVRALRYYVAGFRDGHIQIAFESVSRIWPGVLVARAEDGAIRVSAADPESAVPEGARLIGCDGKSAERLLSGELAPYYANPAIPASRDAALFRLFVRGATDTRLPRLCMFEQGGRRIEERLRWRSAAGESTVAAFARANQVVRPPMGVRRIDGIWLVSIPSFSDEGGLTALISELGKHVAELRDGTVVLDMRGNDGGNSLWGIRMATLLWGWPLVNRVNETFDTRQDFRASSAVRAAAAANAARNPADVYWTKSVASIDAAIAAGRPYAPAGDPPVAAKGPAPASPMNGKIYLLTDGVCASACLDFADLVLRLPCVTHIGRTTSADAIYMDLAQPVPLPSGHGNFYYPMKVYRHRERGNNQPYVPAIRWPGGPMRDDAVIAWVKTLR